MFYFSAKVLMQETQTVWPSRVAIYLFPQEQTKTVLRVGLYTHLPGWFGFLFILIALFFILFLGRKVRNVYFVIISLFVSDGEINISDFSPRYFLIL